MKESSPAFSSVSVVVSLFLLVLLVLFILPPHPLVLLPWAGALAGMNAVLLSFGLGYLAPRTRSALRWVGTLSALVLAAVALTKFGG